MFEQGRDPQGDDIEKTADDGAQNENPGIKQGRGFEQ
jgi:hypothetical protein